MVQFPRSALIDQVAHSPFNPETASQDDSRLYLAVGSYESTVKVVELDIFTEVAERKSPFTGATLDGGCFKIYQGNQSRLHSASR